LEDDADIELVPLEGDEEGEGSFFGSICSQYSFGNLDACERTMKASSVKSKHLCLQEPNMLNILFRKLMPRALL
jgi:hypothetical protein